MPFALAAALRFSSISAAATTTVLGSSLQAWTRSSATSPYPIMPIRNVLAIFCSSFVSQILGILTYPYKKVKHYGAPSAEIGLIQNFHDVATALKRKRLRESILFNFYLEKRKYPAWLLSVKSISALFLELTPESGRFHKDASANCARGASCPIEALPRDKIYIRLRVTQIPGDTPPKIKTRFFQILPVFLLVKNLM